MSPSATYVFHSETLYVFEALVRNNIPCIFLRPWFETTRFRKDPLTSIDPMPYPAWCDGRKSSSYLSQESTTDVGDAALELAGDPGTAARMATDSENSRCPDGKCLLTYDDQPPPRTF
ncbi:hypothetical protein JTB14_012215 [Gonioctena quinquepunctata]|nr:hypothetical protein JTB14_012215 [Gonioctena quinquepunctata]